MVQEISIIKRDGRKEPLDLDKLHTNGVEAQNNGKSEENNIAALENLLNQTNQSFFLVGVI